MATTQPIDVLKPLQRRAAVAWLCWLLSIALLWAEHRFQVLHPYAVPFLVLVLITFLAALGALARGLLRMVRGPRRIASLGWTAVALFPVLSWVGLSWNSLQLWSRGEVPHSLPFVLMQMAGASVMEGQAGAFYPRRLESERLVMFYDNLLESPEDDINKMDRHVASMEEFTGLCLRTKIYYVPRKINCLR